MGNVPVGAGCPLVVGGGMCVLESEDLLLEVGATLGETCARLGLGFVLKASFDKANRTALDAYRGPGLQEGLATLARVRERLGVPVLTDVHTPEQVAPVAQVVDMIQVPAFLCRQTDLLVACGRSGRPVNVKKGQFMAPGDMGPVVDKLTGSGATEVMLTERGVSFGYNELVVDMRGFSVLASHGTPVCFDATHAVQRPGGGGTHTTGDRHHVPALARAAVAAGVNAVFMEVHPNPDQALSDGPNSLCLDDVRALLAQLQALDSALQQG